MKSARDIPRGRINRGYGHLPVDSLRDWATHQTELSRRYAEGEIAPVSSTTEGMARKQIMMKRIHEALNTRSNFDVTQIITRLRQVEAYLEDPGLLENFEYFDIPSSDYMLQFYFAVWDRHIAEVMDYLHNYGNDLKGIAHAVPENDIWYQMSYFEGMNIDKRKQAQSVVEFIRNHHITKATSFGGGHIPERHYGLPDDLHLTVFDDGPTKPLQELFPDEHQRQRVDYIQAPLSKAPGYGNLLNTQELVWMHGVSMYLDESRYQMTGAVLCGASLLERGGYMRYDYLINNASMERVISTQCWPNDPMHPMAIFNGPEAAIRHGCNTLNVVNQRLGGRAFMDVVNIDVNLVEPWGVTCVYFTVQKHV